MARALKLAERGYYSAKPNPRVGCVLVKNDGIIGEGFHYRAGEPHAEINALRDAGDATGSTAYVTLEPCCHHGRTPPCADALIEARVARVVYAVSDPNPRVDGGGAARLINAGIEASGGVMAKAAEQLNRGFFHRMRTSRPFVTVKLGMSVDARVALASGASQWITGPQARADVQRLRAAACAIVTGRGTVVADEPLLTVRDERFDIAGIQPMRVVLDSQLRADPSLKLFDAPGDVIVYTVSSHEAEHARFTAVGAEVETIMPGTGGMDLAVILERLAGRNANNVLVEAGPTLAGAFIGQGLADEIITYVAPNIIGDDARSAFALPAPDNLDSVRRFRFSEMRKLGDDIRLTLMPHDGR